MKYIEELNPGDLFISNLNQRFILTADFKTRDSKKYHCAVSLENGFLHWIPTDDIVDIADLYYRDKENNILLVKEYRNESIENKNIH